MSIVGQVVVESRRYSGWTDPRFPISYWVAALNVVGDASGGTLGIDLLFQTALSLFLNSQMYSVEQLAIITTDNVDRVVRIVAVNMGGPTPAGLSQEYSVPLLAQTNAAKSGISTEALTLLPWFLGSQRTPGVAASLSLVTENTDLTIFKLEAQGYSWSARSVLVDGGPQRPLTGPYGP